MQHLSANPGFNSSNASKQDSRGSLDAIGEIDPGDLALYGLGQKAEEENSDTTPFLGLQNASNQGYTFSTVNPGKQLRVIDQAYVEQIIYFNLNGICHGQKVFESDLQFELNGKKVVKSIQERLIKAKDYIFN